MKRSEVSIKTRSTPASLTIQGQVTKDITVKWLFLERILQNKAGHLMMLTQRSILNRDSTDVDKNKAEN